MSGLCESLAQGACAMNVMHGSAFPVVTVVVPVYNVSKYLNKCLQSIANQTLFDIEVILVDDGSTDDSLEICNEFAATDKRFRVISKINEGQGVARNVGIELARGEFLSFVDSDDWLEVDAYAVCSAALRQSDADFLNFGLDFVSDEGVVTKAFSTFAQEALFGDEIVISALMDDQVFSSPCNKLYRTKFLQSNGLKFPAVRSTEDVFFSRAISLAASKVIFVSRVYYHALIRSGSTTRNFSPRILESAIEVIDLEVDYFRLHSAFPRLRDYFEAHVIKFLSYLMLLAAFRCDSPSAYQRCIELSHVAGLVKFSSNTKAVGLLPVKNRIMLFWALRPRVYRHLASVVKKFFGWSPY
ncbi:glycosyltransferase family A protein [Brachymonas sp. G13]|uniref:glycosyltransferase family 2 protein n=1 Tax=Brachymonas wangyanguii TaxID=3130163 RepID=UPI00307D4B41